MEENILYWIWAQQVFGVGSRKPMQLCRKFSSIRSFFEEAPTLREDHTVFTPAESARASQITLEDCAKIFRQAEAKGMQVLTPDSRGYPDCLRQIAAPPAVLYVQGELPPVDDIPTIAIVGTRQPSEGGVAAARTLSAQLARAGVIVVSGGAIGIDSAAHNGAIEAGGKTVSLLATGLDVPYLKSNKQLRKSIRSHGALVSEFPPGTAARKWHFGIRNRLISGLSCGVLVTEASIKSGSLMTAQHAVEQDRDVFTLMVDCWRSNAEGVLQLLWDGAKPISCAADILVEYKGRFPALQVPERQPLSEIMQGMSLDGPKSSDTSKEESSEEAPEIEMQTHSGTEKPLSADAQALYESLTREPQTVYRLIEKTGLTFSKLLIAVTELEMAGRVQAFSGRRYAKKS